MVITKHAYKRIKSRCGLKKKSVEKLMESLQEKGLPRSKTKGNLRKYLDWLWHSHDESNTIILHNSYIFIFVGDILITVWKVPNKLRKSALSQLNVTFDKEKEKDE